VRIAITGGTGFIGGYLARSLSDKKHKLVLIARGYNTRDMSVRYLPRTQFVGIDICNQARLTESLEKCEAVAHCAGIMHEFEDETFESIHVEGTQNVIEAARKAGVKKIVMLSFYTARPDCGSLYHETKFASEELLRNSGLDYTILRTGMVYGKGDYMLHSLSHALYTLPVLPMVGFKTVYASPLAVEDLVRVMEAALLEDRLSGETIGVLGPDRLTVRECVSRVARVAGRSLLIFPLPLFFHNRLARLMEKAMKIPLLSKTQVRILSEGFDDSYLPVDDLPEDLFPQTPFTAEQIRGGLPEPGPYRLEDLSYYQG
jgi:nucleoside-diphosphate-sugar epimerase